MNDEETVQSASFVATSKPDAAETAVDTSPEQTEGAFEEPATAATAFVGTEAAEMAAEGSETRSGAMGNADQEEVQANAKLLVRVHCTTSAQPPDSEANTWTAASASEIFRPSLLSA